MIPFRRILAVSNAWKNEIARDGYVIRVFENHVGRCGYE